MERERKKKWAYFPPSQGFYFIYLLILLDKTSKNIYRKSPTREKEKKKTRKLEAPQLHSHQKKVEFETKAAKSKKREKRETRKDS